MTIPLKIIPLKIRRRFFLNIQKTLNENGLENQFSELFEMKVGHIRTTEDYENAYSMDAVMESLRSLPQSEDRDVLF